MTCSEFKDTKIQGDPVIPPIINYSGDAGVPPPNPNDTRTRRQKPYPTNGQLYKDVYKETLNYEFQLVPGSLIMTYGDDVDGSEGYPESEDDVIIPLNYDMNYNLINYIITWDNTKPYDYNNPPVIKSEEFSTGIDDFWNSCTYQQMNVIGDNSTITVTRNSFKDELKTFMDDNNVGPELHEDLCNKIKELQEAQEWLIIEDLPDPEEETNDDGKDTSANLEYIVKLVQI